MAAIKLFVWGGVLRDYTGGMAVAVATSPASARTKILTAARRGAMGPETLAKFEQDLAKDPSLVLDFRDAAAYCYGGG